MSAVINPLGQPIGNVWIDRTAAESAAGVTPVSYQYPAGHIKRYGFTSGGNAWSALNNAQKSSNYITCDPGDELVMDEQLEVLAGKHFDLKGAALIRDFDEPANGSGFWSTIKIRNVSDVIFENAVLDGNRSGMETSDFKHGVEILGSENVTLSNVHCIDHEGDGFYVGYTSTPSINVTFYDCSSDNAKRNGLSITAVRGFRDYNGRYDNTQGAASPEGGIDIEPNNTTDECQEIKFFGTTCNGNAGYGVLAANYFAWTAEQRNWQFYGCTANDNGIAGFAPWRTHNVAWYGGEISRNGVGVLVRSTTLNLVIAGTEISENENQGVYVNGEGAATISGVKLRDCWIVDNGQETADTYAGVDVAAILAVDGIDICGNRIGSVNDTTQGYGVKTASTASKVRIVDNDLTDNTQAALDLNDDTDSRITRDNYT